MQATLTRAEALTAFDVARRKHQEFLASIPRERMTEPGATGPWSVKDVIAHVLAWRERTLDRLEAAVAGRPEPPAPWPAGLEDDDPINAWFYEQYRDVPLDEVLSKWDASFDRLRAVVDALPDEALFDPAHFPWMEGWALIEAVPIGFLGHFDDDHEPILRAWLAGEGGQDREEAKTVTNGYAPVKDGKLFYEIEGDGPPLVLLHGLLFNHKLWDDMMPLLAAHYKTIRYDLRGYGKSEATDLKLSDVDDVGALLDHLGLEKAAIVGLSMGGGIAFEYTVRCPERVSALVMAGGGALGEFITDEFEARWKQYEAATRAGRKDEAIDIFTEQWVDGPVSPASEEVRRRAREIMGEYDFAYYIQIGREQAEQATQPAPPPAEPTEEAAPAEEAGTDWEKVVAGLAVPALFISGDRDQPGTIASVHATAAVVPGGEALIIPGAAHIIPLEKPVEFAEAVLDFLARRANWNRE